VCALKSPIWARNKTGQIEHLIAVSLVATT
jgi:hypothetical protein